MWYYVRQAVRSAEITIQWKVFPFTALLIPTRAKVGVSSSNQDMLLYTFL
jgi:hypothetical protein